MTTSSDTKRLDGWGYTPESIALIRSLGRVAANVPDFISFAQNVCTTTPSASKAAVLLDQNNYVALSQTGRNALKDLGNALESFLTLSTSTKESMQDLDETLEKVTSLVNSSTGQLYSSWDSQPDILSHKDSTAFLAFHSELIQALCHVAASKYGLDALLPLREIELDDIDSSFDDLTLARNALLERARSKKELGCWTITRSSENDGFFSQLAGYVFSLKDEELTDIVKRGNYRRINSSLFVEEGISEHVIVGRGFLIGTDYKNSYKLRNAKAHGSLPSYAFEQSGYDIGKPLESISRFFAGDDAFCIHPEELTAALDREERRKRLTLSTSHPCPICGTPVENNLFCSGGRCR